MDGDPVLCVLPQVNQNTQGVVSESRETHGDLFRLKVEPPQHLREIMLLIWT